MVTQFVTSLPSAVSPARDAVVLTIGDDALAAGVVTLLAIGAGWVSRRLGARRKTSAPTLRPLADARRATARRAA
jgi:hypothetical protein